MKSTTHRFKQLLRLNMLILCLLIALPSFSQMSLTDTNSRINRINPAKLICVPDSILRKATAIILMADGMRQELTYTKNEVHLLNAMIFNKDSTIYEYQRLSEDNKAIIDATNGQLDISKQQTKDMQKKYSHLKVNDRLKMGAFCTAIIGLVYIYIEKK